MKTAQAYIGKRLGVMDIGSNSIRMMLFEWDGAGFQHVEKFLRTTRLGKGVDASGRLSEASISRSFDALSELMDIAREEGTQEVYAFATSAMRDAANAEALTGPAREKLGLAIDIVDGDTEAKYGFCGVSSCFSEPVVIADIGGGSTEIICGSREQGIAWDKSLNIGAVRETDKYVQSDPPSPQAVKDIEGEVREKVQALLTVHPKPLGAVMAGIGGTITTLSSIAQHMAVYDPKKIHMSRLSYETVCTIQEELCRKCNAERREIIGMDPKRADIIAAGTTILKAVMAALEKPYIVVCGHDNLEGSAVCHYGFLQ
jgi:exopolyphosphatase/guanosine-5'-triphosphate,3'-diphosphate pyrophosphatase